MSTLALAARAVPCCTSGPPGLWKHRRVERYVQYSRASESIYVAACLLHEFDIKKDLSIDLLVTLLRLHTQYNKLNTDLISRAILIRRKKASPCGSTESISVAHSALDEISALHELDISKFLSSIDLVGISRR